MSTIRADEDAEARACSARIGEKMPPWAPRKGARCGHPAVGLGEVKVAGRLVALPLCRIHLRKLRESDAPAALARSWALSVLVAGMVVQTVSG